MHDAFLENFNQAGLWLRLHGKPNNLNVLGNKHRPVVLMTGGY